MKEDIEKVTRQLTAAVRAEWEIREKLFPLLAEQRPTEYPFGSRDELVKSYTFATLDIKMEIFDMMASVAADLPKPYGDMLCYIAYCDLHLRMKMYRKLAEKLLQSNADAVAPKPQRHIAALV